MKGSRVKSKTQGHVFNGDFGFETNFNPFEFVFGSHGTKEVVEKGCGSRDKICIGTTDV